MDGRSVWRGRIAAEDDVQVFDDAVLQTIACRPVKHDLVFRDVILPAVHDVPRNFVHVVEEDVDLIGVRRNGIQRIAARKGAFRNRREGGVEACLVGCIIILVHPIGGWHSAGDGKLVHLCGVDAGTESDDERGNSGHVEHGLDGLFGRIVVTARFFAVCNEDGVALSRGVEKCRLGRGLLHSSHDVRHAWTIGIQGIGRLQPGRHHRLNGHFIPRGHGNWNCVLLAIRRDIVREERQAKPNLPDEIRRHLVDGRDRDLPLIRITDFISHRTGSVDDEQHIGRY